MTHAMAALAVVLDFLPLEDTFLAILTMSDSCSSQSPVGEQPSADPKFESSVGGDSETQMGKLGSVELVPSVEMANGESISTMLHTDKFAVCSLSDLFNVSN